MVRKVSLSFDDELDDELEDIRKKQGINNRSAFTQNILRRGLRVYKHEKNL